MSTRDRPTCLLLTSEWPPDCIGGLGRYVVEIGSRLARKMPVWVAKIPAYLDVGGALAVPGGPQRAHDWKRYRETLADFDGTGSRNALRDAAQMVARDCLTAIGDAPCVVFVQDYFLAPVAQALRDLGAAKRIVAVSHLPVLAGFTYFDKPITEEVHQILEAQLVRIADAVIAPSRFAEGALRLVHGIPPAKSIVSPLGADRPGPPVPLPHGPLRLAFVGRPNEQKGQHFLFSALSHLKQNEPGVKVSIAGGLADDSRVRQLAIRYGVTDMIDLVPAFAHDDIWPFLDRHHALVTTSVYETFGLSVLEAMASCRATIGFPAGSLPELWGPRLTRLFATPLCDPVALASRLQALARAPSVLESYGAQARERAAAFNWDTHLATVQAALLGTGAAACA